MGRIRTAISLTMAAGFFAVSIATPVIARADGLSGGVEPAGLVDTLRVLNRSDRADPRGMPVPLESGGSIYWTEFIGGEVYRAALNGTGVEEIVSGTGSCLFGIAVDSENEKVYWASWDDKIKRANLNGTAVETAVLTGPGNSPMGIALDVTGGKVYWGQLNNHGIYRANLNGTGVEELVDLEGIPPLGMALDLATGKVYWCDDSPGNKIRRANLDGTGVEELVATGRPMAIALDVPGGKMYWTDVMDKVLRANLDGSDAEELLATPTGISDIVLDLDAGKMYWSSNDLEKIQRANLDGSAVEDVVLGIDIVPGMALHFSGITDCNGNGIPDSEDIIGGTSEDCQTNGIPDECDVAGGTSADCQPNGIPDECDVAGGTSADLNANGVPDECEPAPQGTSEIFWNNFYHGDIYRADLNGTEVEELLTDVGSAVYGMAVDPDNEKIYWGNWDDKIQRSNFDGTEVEDVLLTGPDNAPMGVALDVAGGRVYWGQIGSHGIHRANLSGTGNEELVDLEGVPPLGLALDLEAGKVYWCEDRPGARIRRANLDGSGIEEVVATGRPIGIALDVSGGKMYWTDVENKVLRANLDGSGVEELLATPTGISDIDLDVEGGKMYWSSNDLGLIRRANLDGSEVEDVVAAVGAIPGIALHIVPVADCNGNGVPDDEDIAGGTSADCQPNGIPDECDVAGGTSADCQPNGIPDECDVAGGTSADCQPNGIPDECDVAGGTSADVNANGVPDECEPDLQGTSEIFWNNFYYGDIFRADLNVGEVEEILTDVGSAVYGMAVDSDNEKLYWGNWYDKIQRSNFDGTEVENVLLTGPDNAPVGLALDVVGDRVYWGQLGSHGIHRAYLNGTGNEELVDLEGVPPMGLALDLEAGKVYWCEDSPGNKIRRANLDGSGIEELVATGRPIGIALDVSGGKMYWTDVEDKVLRANLDGSGVEELLATPTGISDIDLDLDGGKMYWSSSDPDRIQRANLDGSEMESVVLGVGTVPGIALHIVPITDCNGNSLPDEYDIAEGISADCQANDIPDECDIAAGTSADCQPNGVPDECETVACDHDLDNGETLALIPGGGDATESARVEITNDSGPDDASVSITEVSGGGPAGATEFQVLGSARVVIETSLADGTYYMTVSAPFTEGDLTAAGLTADDLDQVDLRYFNDSTLAWELAVEGNCGNPPACDAGAIGTRVQTTGVTTVPPPSEPLGDYGVFFNTTTRAGYAFAIVDHATDFAATVPSLIQSPLAAPYPHDRAKNRYLSFDPNKAENDGLPVAFKVTLNALALGSCSGNGAPCRSDDDCRVCSTEGNPCISAVMDCVPPTQSCDLTGEICVNDEAGSVGMSWWVGEPDAQGIARLVGEADRYVTDNWLAAVHAGDCEVVPRATYGVRAVLVGGDQPEPESGQLEVTTIAKPINGYWADAVGDLDYYCTGDWSDCPNGDPDCPLGESCIEQWSPPNGIINFNDVAATVFAFQQAPGLTLPEVMWVDVHGSDSGVPIFDPPDHVANFADIGFIVAAFEGRPYPFSDPADCPN